MVVRSISGDILDALKKESTFIILSLFLGIIIGYFLSLQILSFECGMNNSQENPSLSDLNKAMNDPEFIELLGSRNLTSIDFSTLTDSSTKEEYRQMVFHPEDPDPDDNLAPSMIIVQINESGKVFPVYETYPAYIPPLVGE